jgi:Fe2+ transport system protein FeoA
VSRFDEAPRPLSTLGPGVRGIVVRLGPEHGPRADRLAALGVTPGAEILVLQTFPGIVFTCDQTELAVERAVARGIYVQIEAAAERSAGL